MIHCSSCVPASVSQKHVGLLRRFCVILSFTFFKTQIQLNLFGTSYTELVSLYMKVVTRWWSLSDFNLAVLCQSWGVYHDAVQLRLSFSELARQTLKPQSRRWLSTLSVYPGLSSSGSLHVPIKQVKWRVQCVIWLLKLIDGVPPSFTFEEY